MPKVIVDEIELNCLQSEHKRLKVEHEKLREENEELREGQDPDYRQLNADRGRLTLENRSLQIENEALKSNADETLVSLNERLRKENEDLRDKLNVSNPVPSLNKRIAEIATLTKERDKLSGENEDLHDLWKDAVRKRDELQNEVEDLQDKLDGAHYSKQNNEILRLEKENDNLRDSLNEAIKKRDEVSLDNDRKREYCVKTEKENKSLSDQITGLDEEVIELKATNNRLATVIEDLRSGTEQVNFTPYTTQLEEQVKELTEERDGLQAQQELLDNLQDELVNQRDGLRKAHAEKVDEIQALQLECFDAKHQRTQDNLKADEAIAKLKHSIDKLRTANEELEAELTKSKLTTAAVQETLVTCQEKLHRHRVGMIRDLRTGRRTDVDVALSNLLQNLREAKEG